MFAISSAAIVALFLTGSCQGCVNEPAFYVLWSISSAYFIGDSIYLLVVDPNALVLAHHSVALLGLGFMFAFAEFRLFMILIGLQEISTFLMFFKRIESMGRWKRELDVAFIVCWVVFRGVLSPCLVAWAIVYVVENPSAVTGIHLALHTFFLACNIYWSVEIVKNRMRRRVHDATNIYEL